MTDAAAPDFADLRKQFDGLLDLWEAYHSSGIRAKHGTNVGNFYVAYVFCAHTYRIGRAVQCLMDARFGSECLPLVRSMFEFSITSQWVIQVEQATMSFVSRSLYEKRKTIALIPELRMPDVTRQSIDDALNDIDEADLKSIIRTDFKEICLDLEPAGLAANANYRLMSAYSHPSEFLIGLYLDVSDEDSLPDLATPPRLPALASWSHLALASLVWAGQAIDYVDPEHALRPELQAAARLLGIERVLKPSARVFTRRRQQPK